MEKLRLMSFVHSEAREVLSPANLTEQIVRANFAPNRNIDSGITQLGLGSFNFELGLAMELTQLDSRKREVGKAVLVSSKGVVLVPRDFTQGDEASVTHLDIFNRQRPSYELSDFESDYEIPDSLWRDGVVFHHHRIDNQYGDGRSLWFGGASLHSHPLSLPPSPIDIQLILQNDQHAPFVELVITHYDKYAIFRGENTPHMTSDRAKGAREKHIEMIDSIGANPDIVGVSEEVLQLLILDTIVKKYDLQFFHGDRFDSVLVKKSPLDLLKV